MRYIVVTDLDGTLLDHHTYQFAPANKAIAELQQRQIPMVLNSSKTQAEISAIRTQLDNHEPFVCENGGVLCGISSQSKYLGIPRHQFLEKLRSLKAELNLNYKSFAEATVDDVMDWTGLARSEAQQAMQREATEPILWHDTEVALDTFRQQLQTLKLQCVKGGRFYHVMGIFNKASCFPALRKHYSRLDPEAAKIIALGDSQNDLPMLEQADFAVVIPSTKGIKLQLDRDNLFVASQPGPDGWQEGIDFFLKTIS